MSKTKNICVLSMLKNDNSNNTLHNEYFTKVGYEDFDISKHFYIPPTYHSNYGDIKLKFYCPTNVKIPNDMNNSIRSNTETQIKRVTTFKDCIFDFGPPDAFIFLVNHMHNGIPEFITEVLNDNLLIKFVVIENGDQHAKTKFRDFDVHMIGGRMPNKNVWVLPIYELCHELCQDSIGSDLRL